MRLIVGLGNPGERYAPTPHNLGFLVVEAVARTMGLGLQRREAESLLALGRSRQQDVILAKPQTYMNLSGRAVKKLLEQWGLPPRDMVVVVDDLDLPWGQIRIRARGGPGTHNGMRSIVDWIGSTDFPRIRLGIRPAHPLEDAAAFVLSPFAKWQRDSIHEFAARGAEAVLAVVDEGMNAAMNRFNGAALGADSSEPAPDSK